MTQPSIESHPRRSPQGSSFKSSFYKQCRKWHAYLSAFAFIALMFFSATGILLNHPDWFPGDETPDRSTITLSPEQLAAAQSAADMPRALLDIVRSQVALRGAFSDGFVENGAATIRLQGVKGASDIVVDLKSGGTEVSVQRPGVVTILNELHRGVMSGPVWKAVIDIVAGIILILSLIGYLLFFSLRFRLRTSLVLTGVSLGLMAFVFAAFVP